MQTDLEEAKAQEVVKLQNSLQELQNKADETNACQGTRVCKEGYRRSTSCY